MKGGLNLEVRMERAVQISAKLAVSVNDFFDNLQDKFLQSFAYAMGIPLSRFQVGVILTLQKVRYHTGINYIMI